MHRTLAIVALSWAAGLVAGLLLRSPHLLLPSLVIVAVNAAAGGAVYRLTRGRP